VPFVKNTSASTASHRAFRDDREPPLLSGETGGEKPLICPTAKAKYFFGGGWTGFSDLPVGLDFDANSLRHSGTRPLGAGPESILPDRGYGFPACADRFIAFVPFSRLAPAADRRNARVSDQAIARSAMRAFLIAALYFGSFLTIGLIAKLAADRFSRGTDLTDIQSQAGPNRRKHKAFLLGAWRNEE
jgi:hypothetical protein